MPSLAHPYAHLTGGRWLSGNLHAHSTRSDGTRSPQEVIDTYAALGHHFLMFADHDLLASPATYAPLNPRGLLLLPGNEISANGPHLLHVDARAALRPCEQRQQVMDQARTSGGFIIACHPNWYASFNHTPIEQLREWVGYAGLEIYNGVVCELDGSPYATNKWDMLLAEGRRLWGFANDDFHGKPTQHGLGWNVVYVMEPTVAQVVAALQTGRFYPSTGVRITGIAVEGLRIRVQTANAQRIVAIRDTGRRFAQVDAAAIEVTAPEDARYVRFACWGAGEQFAWTQPFFVVPD